MGLARELLTAPLWSHGSPHPLSFALFLTCFFLCVRFISFQSFRCRAERAAGRIIAGFRKIADSCTKTEKTTTANTKDWAYPDLNVAQADSSYLGTRKEINDYASAFKKLNS